MKQNGSLFGGAENDSVSFVWFYCTAKEKIPPYPYRVVFRKKEGLEREKGKKQTGFMSDKMTAGRKKIYFGNKRSLFGGTESFEAKRTAEKRIFDERQSGGAVFFRRREKTEKKTAGRKYGRCRTKKKKRGKILEGQNKNLIQLTHKVTNNIISNIIGG